MLKRCSLILLSIILINVNTNSTDYYGINNCNNYYNNGIIYINMPNYANNRCYNKYDNSNIQLIHRALLMIKIKILQIKRPISDLHQIVVINQI